MLGSATLQRRMLQSACLSYVLAESVSYCILCIRLSPMGNLEDSSLYYLHCGQK